MRPRGKHVLTGWWQRDPGPHNSERIVVCPDRLGDRRYCQQCVGIRVVLSASIEAKLLAVSRSVSDTVEMAILAVSRSVRDTVEMAIGLPIFSPPPLTPTPSPPPPPPPKQDITLRLQQSLLVISLASRSLWSAGLIYDIRPNYNPKTTPHPPHP